MGEKEIKKILVHTGDGCDVYWAGEDSPYSRIEEISSPKWKMFRLFRKNKNGTEYISKEIINMPVELTYREPR